MSFCLYQQLEARGAAADEVLEYVQECIRPNGLLVTRHDLVSHIQVELAKCWSEMDGKENLIAMLNQSRSEESDVHTDFREKGILSKSQNRGLCRRLLTYKQCRTHCEC